MIFQNISNDTTGNFYSGFMELESLKLFYVMFNIILTFVAPLILYSIVWYERFGADLMYRTLSNRSLSHICLISIARCLIARIASVGYLFIIPLSSNTCDVIVFIGRYSVLCTFSEIVIWQLVKYVYIFRWKYLVCWNDEFFATILTMCNILLTTVFLFFTYMTGHHNAELDYHLCTGRSASANILTSYRYRDIFFFNLKCFGGDF
jgi:hypothetical protein